MKRLLALALPLLALAVAGCGSSSSSSSSSSTGSAAASTPAASTPATSTPAAGGSGSSGSGGSIHVSMKNVAFLPKVVQAKVGQTILWTNDDTPPHNVTYVGGPHFASSSTLNPGQRFTLKLTQAGTISYFCTIHPFMKASIVVAQ